MPHCRPKNEVADSEAGNASNPGASSGADLLLSLAATASEHAPPVARLPAQPDSSVKPSPIFTHGARQPWTNHSQAPSYPSMQQAEEASMMMSFRGGNQLLPSPIKAQATAGNNRSPAEEAAYTQLSHPSHTMWPHYGMPGYQPPVPTGNSYSHAQQQDLSEEVSAANRSVPANPDHHAAQQPHSESVDRSFDSQDSERKRPLSKSALPQQKTAKNNNGQRVISPASSNEGPITDKEDSTNRQQNEKKFDPVAHAHHPPYNHGGHGGYMHPGAFAPPGGYCYPPYGYPPAPYQPYVMMHAPPHGSMYPMHPPAPFGVPQHMQPPLQQADDDADTASETQREVPRNPSPHHAIQSAGTQREVLLDSSAHHSIQSVADWQQATVASGKVPSTNRCVALKPPVPSRFWGKSDKTHDVKLPDFHLLVNYPDYITKGRSTVDKAGNAAPEGQKHCVMCGKLRICSSSSSAAVRVNRAAAAVNDGDDYNAMNIIPRQNKGVCTACDITVWVIITMGQESLEIKWCKGCKNFRPWAAFGEKGLATKCVRCRDRQKEKYLWQKKETYRRSHSFREEKKEDDELAARGLQGLMQAADA